MRPKKGNEGVQSSIPPDKDDLAEKFPGLAIPNAEQIPLSDEEQPTEENKEDTDVVADLMAQFEAQAPSGSKRERSKSRDRKRERSRSRNRDRERRNRSRSRDRTRDRKRERSRDRRRQRSRSRERRRSRDRKRSRSRDRKRERSIERRRHEVEMDDDPVPGKIYNGKVANIVPFGCFVQLEGLRRRWEGLVHISQLRAEGRVTNVSEVVSRGNKVKVIYFAYYDESLCKIVTFKFIQFLPVLKLCV